MKILYIDPFSVPNSMGGSQKSLLDIMMGIKCLGHQVIFGSPGGGLLHTEVENKGIKTTKFLLPDLVDTRVTVGTRRIFNIFAAVYDVIILFVSGFSLFLLIRKTNPDIVHANQMLISIAVGFACKLAKVPCVWHIRENPSEHIPESVIKTFGLLGHLLSDQIIVNSQFTANIYRNTKLLKKMVVVPIGINSLYEHNLKEDANLKNNSSNAIKVISIFARIIPMKGYDVLIEALKIILEKGLECRLFILGHVNQTDPYYLSLRALIDELGLISHIEFCGFQSNIEPILNSSDIVVSSSIESETFGRTLIEAMAARKPVAATWVGAHPEIIEDGVTGFLVEPNNPQALADCIEKVLLDDRLAKSMGKRGRERYEKYFTLEKYCKKIENIYDRLII